MSLIVSSAGLDHVRAIEWLVMVDTPGCHGSFTLPLLSTDRPDIVAKKLKKAFKEHVPRKQRFAQRYMLLRKPVIDMATLSSVRIPYKLRGHLGFLIDKID